MPTVKLKINNRDYGVICEEGKEGHLKDWASYLNEKVTLLAKGATHAGEARLLLLAALLITDELFESRARQRENGSQASFTPATSQADFDKVSMRLQEAVLQIELLAESIQKSSSSLTSD